MECEFLNRKNYFQLFYSGDSNVKSQSFRIARMEEKKRNDRYTIKILRFGMTTIRCTHKHRRNIKRVRPRLTVKTIVQIPYIEPLKKLKNAARRARQTYRQHNRFRGF